MAQATIKLGSTGADVTQLQNLLNAFGYAVAVTGTFDAATDAAVRKFQSSKGLTADGIVGPMTWAALTGGSAATPAGPGPNEAGTNRLWQIAQLLERTDNAFRWGLIQVGARLKTDPNYLAGVMRTESGFRPDAVNPDGGATGLIQFMPATAVKLGTTTAELKQMTALEQLVYVEKYFKSFTGKMKTPTDVYMATFMPAFVGKPADFVLGREGDDTKVFGLTLNQIYKSNKGFDKNKDGTITVGEVGATVEATLAAARQKPPIDVTPEGDLIPATGDGETGPIGFEGESTGGASLAVIAVGLAGLAATVWKYGWPWTWRLPR